MTDRQNNTRLINDKLTQLPVPQNDALWSRIEAQLKVAATADRTHTRQKPKPKKNPRLRSAKKPVQSAVQRRLSKGYVVVFSAALIILLVLLLLHKRNPPLYDPAIPKPVLEKKILPADSFLQPDTVVQASGKPINILPLPVQKPEKKEAVAVSDSLLEPSSLPIRQPPALVFTRDSNRLLAPGAVHLVPDSVQIRATLPAEKKDTDEQYYFDIKKRRKD